MDKAVIKANNNPIMRGINKFMIVFMTVLTVLIVYGTCMLIVNNVKMQERKAGNVIMLEIKTLYSEDVTTIAKIVQCEAGNQCEYGRRLVADTVLNRVDSDVFPDTVEEVVSAPKQYTVINSKRFKECEPDEESLRIVAEEMSERTNTEVIYFASCGYINGRPLMQVEGHYFSK